MAAETIAPDPATLPILQDTTSSRLSHGLKHGDHLRYRRYCTRRVARVRAACSLRNGRSSVYAATALTPDAVRAAPRALLIPLVLAERAWAHAMDAKTAQPAGPARARRVVLAKMRRAVAHAEQLAKLCRDVADEDTVLEAEAYARGMQALLALEQEKWTLALAAYQTAQKIYEGMAGVRAGSSGAALYEKRLEEVNQGIRFCNYNLARSEGGADDDALLQGLRTDKEGPGADVLAEKIEKALVEARRKMAQSFGEVVWCGITVPLRAEKVREAVLMADQESDMFGTAERVEAYDKLFMVYNDAIKVVADELSDFRKSGAAEERVRELEYLVAYVTYQRLQRTVERNLLLVESFRNKRASKPDDFVRLFDNLIANMTDILALPGVDTDAAMSNDAEARRKLFRAYRCFHLAQCYQAAKLESEAAALFDRVSDHAKALTGTQAKEAARIVTESTGMKCRAKAQAFLNEQQLTSAIGALGLKENEAAFIQKVKMVDHLDAFESFASPEDPTRVICEMPPALEAVPCKPVMFDLAIDGVRFPGDEVKAEAKVEEKKAEPDNTPAAGFQPLASTRFGRWWSGKG